MSSAEREALRVLLEVAKEGEWFKGRCPRCGFEQLRGHKCSCPVKRAYKLFERVLGQFDPGIEDEDLIVESAVRDLAKRPEAAREIVWEAVTDAMHLGARK